MRLIYFAGTLFICACFWLGVYETWFAHHG